MKILITGASGLLGGNLSFLYASRHRVIATYFRNAVAISGCQMHRANILNAHDMVQVLERERPEVLIHCAANANVDDCEASERDAYAVNVSASTQLAELAKKFAAKFVFISTDSVFTENRTEPFRENDPTNPKNVYARTKLEAEGMVQSLVPSALVVRTCIYGFNILEKMSLAEWLVAELIHNRQIVGFTDLFFSPILVNDLSVALECALQGDLKGVYHIAARDFVSKYDFAVQLAKQFGFSPSMITPASVLSSQLKAYRPNRPCLNVSKFESATATLLPTVQEGIRHLHQLCQTGFHTQLKMCNFKKPSLNKTSIISNSPKNENFRD